MDSGVSAARISANSVPDLRLLFRRTRRVVNHNQPVLIRLAFQLSHEHLSRRIKQARGSRLLEQSPRSVQSVRNSPLLTQALNLGAPAEG